MIDQTMTNTTTSTLKEPVAGIPEDGNGKGSTGFLPEALPEEDFDYDNETLQMVDRLNAATTDPITLYLNATHRVALLKAEEEVELAKQIEAGIAAETRLAEEDCTPEEIPDLEELIEDGFAARERFIESNTRLVISIAKKYRGYGLPFMDLIQAGNEGLIKAVDRFDYNFGNRFSTYATSWIRQAILRHLMQQKRTIRIPLHVNARIRKMRKAVPELMQKLGHWPTDDEIADEMELPSEEIRRLQRVSQPLVSLNKLVGDDESEAELETLLEDDSEPSTFLNVQRRLLHQDLRQIMDEVLTEREIYVLSLRWGLDGNDRHTLKALAGKLGISGERVRQIERKALSKMRSPCRRSAMLEYVR